MKWTIGAVAVALLAAGGIALAAWAGPSRAGSPLLLPVLSLYPPTLFFFCCV